MSETTSRSRLRLRVSVLDRCQYRCPYCRPGALAPFAGREERLSPADYARVAPAFRAAGVDAVRFTGGEPLLRDDLCEIVAAFRDAIPGCDLALTTNGHSLARCAPLLARAGLTRATVHVDTLSGDRYRAFMGDGDVERVLEALKGARAVLREVKLNTVVQRGKNDDEIGAFLEFSRKTGIEVRFIELMNTGSAVAYTREVFFSGAEIVDAVRRIAGATAIPRRSQSDPAALWRTDDGLVFGVIASDTEPFCDACNRLRLSSTGVIRGCLYQGAGVDLSGALRARDDGEITALVMRAVRGKASHHPSAGLVPTAGLVRFSMAELGG